MKFISVIIFILSLAIGLFVVYITAPKAQVIYVYPNETQEMVFDAHIRAFEFFGGILFIAPCTLPLIIKTLLSPFLMSGINFCTIT